MAETTMSDELTKTQESNGDWKEEEEEEEHNFEKLLHSLPREDGWVAPYIYLFQHVWFRPSHLESIISFQKHFQSKDSDIVIASFPKSGTTWLKALAFATVKRNHFLPSQQNHHHPLLNSNPHTLVPFFEVHNNAISDLSSISEPRMFGTHLPFHSLSHSVHSSNCKIVYICRNPFDTLISYWHFLNNVSPLSTTLTLEEAFRRYCEGIIPFGPFWSNILGYWKASKETPNKVLFLKYEDLKANTHLEVKRMAQFLDCPFTEEEESVGVIDSIIELCSFEKMKGLEVNKSGKSKQNIEFKNFFRKGEIGDWVNYFSPWMVEKLSKVIQEKFSGSGLSF